MALVITVAGVDKTSSIDWTNLSLNQVLTKQSDEMVFHVKAYGTKNYKPLLSDEVIFTNGSTRVFAGNIIQINVLTDGVSQTYECIVKDYSHLLDSQLVSKTYTGQTVAAIITDLLATFSDGTFTSTNVVCSTVISSITFNYITISECIKKLVALLQNYEWYVDYNKDVHFFATGTVLSAYNLDDNTENYDFNSLVVSSDTSQLANDIVVQSGAVGDANTRIEYFNGDGTRTIFPLASNFNTTPTVTVGGVSKTVGIDGVDADASFQSMWNQDSQRLRFTTGNTPAAGTNNIVVTGISRFPLISRKQDQTSIAAYGQKQKIIIDKTIQDATAASLRASSELSRYSVPNSIARFRTHTDGLQVGQYIAISTVPVSKNLAVHYAFEEGSGAVAKDLSGNGNDGVITAATFVAGWLGKALSFNGTTAVVSAPSSTTTEIGGTALSIFAWIKPTSLAGFPTIVSKNGVAQNYQLGFDNAGSHLRLCLSGFGCQVSAGTIPTGSFSHVGITYDGANVKFWINGVVDTTFAFTGVLPTSSADAFTIGDATGGGFKFAGVIDEVRVYNAALSASDVQRLYKTTIISARQSYKIQNIRISARTPSSLQYEVQANTQGDVTMNDILSKLLIQDPANLNLNNQNVTITRIFLFAEASALTDAIHTPTTSTGPYLWDSFNWNLGTWG